MKRWEKEACSLKGDLHHLLYMTYFDSLKYEMAKHHAEKALHIYEAIQDFKGLAIAASAMGTLSQYTYKSQEALMYFWKTIQIKKSKIKAPDLTTSYFNLACTYYNCRQYMVARYYFLKSYYEVKQRYGEEYPLIIELKKLLGEIAIRSQEYEFALVYLQESIDLQQKLNNYYKLADNYLCIGRAYFFQKNWDKSENYLLLAAETSEKINSNNYKILYFIYGSIGEIYQKGDKYILAEKYLRSALKTAEHLPLIQDFIRAKMYWRISKGYCERKDFLKALGYIEKATQFWEKASNSQKKQNTSLLF